ncbi:DNA replication and repair protein RecF [Odoribacter sp. OttesenSCG-928-J03]|nr:DNA replication and repair protein RecF [Odoribacter sp. OttesenSCG-928-J03]MDL2283137.1 DNA replication and repair protein RecF [Odoribacter sp. OttesenSCG-928-G04]MDL2330493.1 DNA replication and repair protein RecF [Odoribacter sp. OttesenSCG-928-A06]
MFIEELHIVNFKNIEEVNLTFCPGFNCFVGNNGAGKTNILDAIYQLSMCKSYFNLPDSQNIRHGEAFFVVQGKYSRQNEELNIYCGVKRGQKKVFKKNQKTYERLSEHIGLLPVVIISPEDSQLIDGGSDERRKLIDGIISQYDKAYLHSLISYNKALEQRNSLLKNYAGTSIDPDVLEIWDDKLVEFGELIMRKRIEFLTEFKELFQQYYERISSGRERVVLEYNPSVKDGDIRAALRKTVEKDRILSYTSSGIHRDDMVLTIDGYPVKKVGSQGQKKTFLISLKLAQYIWLNKISAVKPLLLLDDIFDKLDTERVSHIIRLVGSDVFGQIFITDTNRLHIDELLRSQKNEYALFRVEEGEVVR